MGARDTLNMGLGCQIQCRAKTEFWIKKESFFSTKMSQILGMLYCLFTKCGNSTKRSCAPVWTHLPCFLTSIPSPHPISLGPQTSALFPLVSGKLLQCL